MFVNKSSYQLLYPRSKQSIEEMLSLVEQAARLCYKSEGLMGSSFNPIFLRSKIDSGHESVIEHSMISVKIICDRGVTHEVVRHRIASFSQESTRYCNYNKEKFGNSITVIDLTKGILLDSKMVKMPAEVLEQIMQEWVEAMHDAERHYLRMIELGATPQIARSVLPNSTKTEIVVTMNFREWRHFFRLRTPISAHPQMREITIPMLNNFKEVFPVIFDDINIVVN